ncbi:MmgE/PrpD family protein [Paraburkholderia sp. BCC1886]|uniref:MmgE/PrpD family protein n=1 Tax=Paraburkholderia sp. BCC1886 TaxID=2562670 RepID=UPI001183F6B6|nr:MmgE/PrpD family protein [Paraburkholderia sp. BCC1886]
MSLAEVIATYGVKTPGSAIPEQVYRAGGVAAVDAISCMIAGARTDVARAVGATLQDAPAGQGASVIGGTRRMSARDAAMANGTSGHALDFDDVLWSQYGHPSVVVLPAALAVAELSGANGRDVLAAYVLGIEVVSRLGSFVNPTHYEHGWHTTSTLGVFGAALAAARLMHLGVAQTATAISIAASMSSGVRRNFGSMTKPFHAGNAARAGVHAAELAHAGMTADSEALEGPAGWFAVLGARQMPDDAALRAALSDSWDVIAPGIVLKRYGACGCTHCALDALISLKQTHGFKGEDVETIECVSHPLAKKVLQHARPETGLEGKFSMEHSLAAAAADGMLTLAHYEDAAVQREDVRRLVPRVRFEIDEALAAGSSADAVPAIVTVRLRDGRVFSERVDIPMGDPRRPLQDADRRQKLATCMALDVNAAGVDALWNRLEQLDGETDWRALWTLTAQG